MQTETPSAPPRYRFSGHETFPFRYAWLPKGINAVSDDSGIFLQEDAMVRLGVGKNMVQSIRHWCETLGLIQSKGRSGTYAPTTLGKKLLSPRGWDPFLEDIGTLWLLHWQLSSRAEGASTWHLAFTQWSPESFSSDDLVKWLQTILPPGSRASANSLKRDVEVFLRTYVARGSDRSAPGEDAFDCPLVELGLIQQIGSNRYRFVRGPKTSLPDAILHYSLIDFWRTTAEGQKTISFESVLHQPGSPGAVFKLSENALSERLERLPNRLGISFDETAGLRQLLLRRNSLDVDPFTLLAPYYEKRR